MICTTHWHHSMCGSATSSITVDVPSINIAEASKFRSHEGQMRLSIYRYGSRKGNSIETTLRSRSYRMDMDSDLAFVCPRRIS
jgi:hypothetical protein